MEITKAWKQEIPELFDVERRKRKQKMVKMLLLQSFCKHQKVVYGQPSIKCTSWKGNDMLCYYIMLLKVD